MIISRVVLLVALVLSAVPTESWAVDPAKSEACTRALFEKGMSTGQRMSRRIFHTAVALNLLTFARIGYHLFGRSTRVRVITEASELAATLKGQPFTRLLCMFGPQRQLTVEESKNLARQYALPWSPGLKEASPAGLYPPQMENTLSLTREFQTLSQGGKPNLNRLYQMAANDRKHGFQLHTDLMGRLGKVQDFPERFPAQDIVDYLKMGTNERGEPKLELNIHFDVADLQDQAKMLRRLDAELDAGESGAQLKRWEEVTKRFATVTPAEYARIVKIYVREWRLALASVSKGDSSIVDYLAAIEALFENATESSHRTLADAELVIQKRYAVDLVRRNLEGYKDFKIEFLIFAPGQDKAVVQGWLREAKFPVVE